MSAPRLVFAVGNASRGDDALGPALLALLREAGVERGGRVELLEDYQLQPEHALDLAGRQAVLFVDAAHGERAGLPGVRLERLWADPAVSWTTHALRPQALLSIYARVQGEAPPPAWLLSIEGHRFELGAPLTADAQARLDEAFARACAWLRPS
jgi:hydrogenase maturation protease